VLREEIARADGALVKTIGDAIMAVFPRPSAAVRAMLQAQWRLTQAVDGGTPLALKVGVHHGPCIAVTMNERLDYFGSVVNLASRLERFSSGTDVIISDAIRHDPEVEALLADEANHLAAEHFEARLKGFDEEEFGLWRIFRRN
jgi:class 3 adenylate cyclase